MSDQHELTRRLAAAGFIAADEESQELLDAAKGDDDVLVSLFGRRLSGCLLYTSVAHRQKVATDLRTLDAADASFVAAFQSATALIGVCHGYAVVAGFAGSIAGASMSEKKPNDYVKTAVKELDVYKRQPLRALHDHRS